MDMQLQNQNTDESLIYPRNWANLAAILAGVAVPAVVFGRAVLLPLLVVPVALAIYRINWTSLKTPKFRTDDRGLLAYAICATSLIWLISSFGSIEPAKSLATWSRTIALIALAYFLISFLSSSERLLEMSIKALITTSAFVLTASVYSLYVNEIPFEIYRFFKGTNAILLQTLKPYYSVSACILPVVLWGGWRYRKVWGVLALSHIPLTALLVYGRGEQPGLSSIFGLFASIALIGVIASIKFFSARTVWVVVASLIVSIIIAASYVIYQLPVPPVSATQAPNLMFPDWHRQVIWGFTAEVVKDAPFLGVGPNTVNLVFGANEIIPGLNQEYIPAHPHNWPLEIAAETGLLGFTCFAFTLFIALRCLGRIALKGNSAAWAAIALFGAFWSSSLANFSIWSAWWLTVLCVLISLTTAALILENQRSDDGLP
jgi:O-antigen ligase